VKYRERAEHTADSGLAEFCRTEAVERAFLITQRDVDFDVTSPLDASYRILRIPAHIFTYLIGHADQVAE
jgi:hypothetical protein